MRKSRDCMSSRSAAALGASFYKIFGNDEIKFINRKVPL
jgi:hypothetical protein